MSVLRIVQSMYSRRAENGPAVDGMFGAFSGGPRVSIVPLVSDYFNII